MTQVASTESEAHGASFSVAAIVKARDLTFEAVHRVAAAIRPGMTEAEACARADQIIADMGADRIWHKSVIRFAKGTLDTFHAPFDAGRALGRSLEVVRGLSSSGGAAKQLTGKR